MSDLKFLTSLLLVTWFFFFLLKRGGGRGTKHFSCFCTTLDEHQSESEAITVSSDDL